MTEQTQSPQDQDPARQIEPRTGDVTEQGQGPTVDPADDDPDREGEERFDAG